MVVRIKTGKRIRGVLSYNERKVSAGKAELILASRFICNLEQLGFTEKLARFQRLNQLNPKITTNTLHLSLNFSPYDNLNDEKLQAIAWEYMERIGFGNQPFLVYRHDDSAHPHVHIVTNLVRPDGSRIKTHNLGRIQSENARKALEKEFDLIPAESMRKVAQLPFLPINVEKALYGEKETKLSISNIVRNVTTSYHFTSMGEFNAILKQYNVIADPGRPGSRMNANKGLVYSMLDKHGYKTGIPIKASSIYSNPTIEFLEKKFKQEENRKPLYQAYSTKIIEDFSKRSNPYTEAQAKAWFARRKIHLDFLKNDYGVIKDIRLVDNMKKVVFSGAELKMPVNQFLLKIRQPEPKFVNTRTDIQKLVSGYDYSIITDTTLKWIQSMSKEEFDPTAQIPEHLRKRKKRSKKKK